MLQAEALLTCLSYSLRLSRTSKYMLIGRKQQPGLLHSAVFFFLLLLGLTCQDIVTVRFQGLTQHVCEAPCYSNQGSHSVLLALSWCASEIRLSGLLPRTVRLMVCSAYCTHLLQNGEALIKYGERGDKLYLIRYGKVRILRPDDSAPGGRVEVAKLGRGNLVGERTVVTGAYYGLLHTIVTSA